MYQLSRQIEHILIENVLLSLSQFQMTMSMLLVKVFHGFVFGFIDIGYFLA